MEPCPVCRGRVQAVGYNREISETFTPSNLIREPPDGMIQYWEVFPCMHKISTALYSIRFEFGSNYGKWIPEPTHRKEPKKVHSSFEKDCVTCGGTGKEPSNALRAALEAARLRKPLAGTAVQTIQLEDIIKTALTEYLRVVEKEEEEARKANRRTWNTGDPEPGPEVTAVLDSSGAVQIRDGNYWREEFTDDRDRWAYIVEHCGPLEDWTHEFSA